MSSVNPYQSPSEPNQLKPPGPQFAPCPRCNATDAKRVDFSLWGGVIGPRLLTHVKCNQCGAKYNGKTGRSNTMPIVIYSVVVFGIVLALWLAFRLG
jgi:hypothetical protein